MKRILTAINNPVLNEELRKKEYIEVIGKDIQYKEGIIETLENNKNKKIDIIIISEELPGTIENKKLLELIKNKNEKIKIIYILEKENIIKEKELKELNINSIYYNNKITLEEIINRISENEINKEEEMKKEIEKLKKIIEKNNKINKKKIIKIISEKINNKFKKREKNKIKNNKNKNNKKSKNKKIIKIIGSPKTGKTTFAIILSEKLRKKNKKILLIDLDKNKKSLTKKILKKNKIIKKYEDKTGKIKYIKKLNKRKKIKRKIYNKKIKIKRKELKKINDNIFILNVKNKKTKNIINDIEKYEIFFDYIIVDTKNKNDLKILNKKSENVLIINGKKLGIQELERIFYIDQKNSHKSQKSLHIVINKVNKKTIMKDILEKIFNNIESITYIKKSKLIK